MSSLDYASTVRMVNMSVPTPTLQLPFHSDPTLLATSSDPSLVYMKGFWLALTTLHTASAIYATLLSLGASRKKATSHSDFLHKPALQASDLDTKTQVYTAKISGRDHLQTQTPSSAALVSLSVAACSLPPEIERPLRS